MMHVPKTYLSGNDWPTNDTVETEYIGSLENTLSAFIREAKNNGYRLSNMLEVELNELAKANQNLGDTLHMTDSENMVTVEGRVIGMHKDDHSITYTCKTKEFQDAFRLMAFAPNAAIRHWSYRLDMMDGVHGEQVLGTAHSGYRHLSFEGIPLDDAKDDYDEPDTWLDSYSGDGIVFHYDNLDHEFVLKLDGPSGDYPKAAAFARILMRED